MARRASRRGRTPAKYRGKPTDKQYMKAFAAWRDRGEHINDLAAQLRVRRGTLRHHLTKLAGGYHAFKALRADGAGGLRPSLGERPKSARLDRDAKILRVGQRKNWKYRQMHASDSEVAIPVFVAPGRGRSQVTYVPARANQKADVIAEMGNGLPPARLVKAELRAD